MNIDVWDEKCPLCHSEQVEYDETMVAGEMEWWYCKACKGGFYVKVMICRLSALGARETEEVERSAVDEYLVRTGEKDD